MTRNTHDRQLDHHGTDLDSNIELDGATANYLDAADLHAVISDMDDRIEAARGGGVIDLVTGSSFNFAADVGSWATTGTQERDTTADYLFFGHPASLKFTSTTQGQYVELAIPGTFLAGVEYQAQIYVKLEPFTPTSMAYRWEFGLIGTDYRTEEWGTVASSFEAGYIAKTWRWKPTADRTGVKIRFTRMDTTGTGTIVWHIGQARVVEVSGGDPGLMLRALPNTGTSDRNLLLAADYLQMGSAGSSMALRSDSFDLWNGPGNAGLYGSDAWLYFAAEHVPADLPSEGLEFYAGDDWLGIYLGQKNADTLQWYADGDHNIEFADAATGRWRFRSADNAFATPSMGMLPQYATAPATPIEGQSYYDTTLHMSRTWDGTAWKDWWM